MTKRVLILGAGGMLGHKLCQLFRHRFETYATVRTDPSAFLRYGLIDAGHLAGHVEGHDFESLVRAVGESRPHVVVNCIGIVKQVKAAKDPLASLAINAMLPHRLADLCGAAAARLIHISTDCVFSGRKGGYSEKDLPDADDLYGRTKLLGEVDRPGCLTLRVSILGRELRDGHGLLERLLFHRGDVMPGYRRAIYSGLTTPTMAEIIGGIIDSHSTLSGVWHVASEPITKYDLLVLANQIFHAEVRIVPDDSFVCDRSLDGRRFCEATGFRIPSWHDMIQQVHSDSFPYDSWRAP